MQNKKLKLSAGLLFILGLTGLQAQESINTSGGEISGSGGSVSYSVGQIVYQTSFSTNSSVAEGVQQPYEISVVTSVEEAKGITLSVTAYPNPATDNLTLEINGLNMDHLSYQLYDLQGKSLQYGEISGNRVSIFVGNLSTCHIFREHNARISKTKTI